MTIEFRYIDEIKLESSNLNKCSMLLIADIAIKSGYAKRLTIEDNVIDIKFRNPVPAIIITEKSDEHEIITLFLVIKIGSRYIIIESVEAITMTDVDIHIYDDEIDVIDYIKDYVETYSIIDQVELRKILEQIRMVIKNG